MYDKLLKPRQSFLITLYIATEYLVLPGEWESGPTIPGKFLNVLKKDGEDKIDRVRKEVLHRVKADRNILGTINRRMAN